MARIGAVLLAVALGVAGCGDDDDEESLALTLTETGLEGLPEELTAGVVAIELTDDTEAAGGEVNFTRVEDGTTEDAFLEAIESVFAGGPIPDVLLDTSGVIERSTVVLDEGEHVVWYDLASNLERESTPHDIVTTPVTVAEGDGDAEPPDADGTVTATDDDFEVDVQEGSSTVNFFNDSSAQLHHVVFVDFGTNDPAVVEEKLPACSVPAAPGRSKRPSRRATPTPRCASSRTARAARPTPSPTRCTRCSRSGRLSPAGAGRPPAPLSSGRGGRPVGARPRSRPGTPGPASPG